ncbi:PKD domain-containing protein [uncultured Chitinophaga sp.]|jgi:FOG: PKD repeat|uniref:gliding motility-associated C-terminal domain-containing protein n=1 Tax=uncultured Chitinophaga sp. TaxID=339340 RepID=UPI002635B47F|nr:PKD domain-containing protein [uncultured Chitinophaga sp.]
MKTIFIALLLVLYTGLHELCAQTYTPVAVTGFNNDVVAESGTSTIAATSTDLDLSFNILYTAAFAATNGIAGGLPDNGLIVNGARSYQLADYDADNGLFLSANGAVANTAAAGTLTLATPATFSRISLLLFSTEGATTVSATLNFTDGTSVAGGNMNVQDWFDGGNAVVSGFGRITRKAFPPYIVDGAATNNPRFYRFDIPIACANQSKLLQSVTITYLSGSGTLFPTRACILALSGVAYTPLSVVPVITNAVCGGGSGSIALTVSGGTAPLFYSWNTLPVQTQPVATNLSGGNYTCTITDANGCSTTYQGTVLQQSPVTLSLSASDTLLCEGQSATLSVSASGTTVNGYTWQPTNDTGASVPVTPALSTRYIVSTQDVFGCILKDSVDIAVKPLPLATFTVTPAEVCLGTPQTVAFTGSAGDNAVFNWHNFSGAAVQSGSGSGPYNILFNAAGDYTLQLQITDSACVSALVSQSVNVSEPPVISIHLSDPTPCAGDLITITATGNAGNNATTAWNWGGGAAQGGNGFGPFSVQYRQSGTVSLTVTDGVCTVNVPPQQVNVIPLPVAAFSVDSTTGCPDFPVAFTNLSQQADTWLWRFGDGDLSSEAHPAHTYTTAGSYTVTLIAGAQQQCFDTLQQTALINVQASPRAVFTVQPGVNLPLEYSEALFSFSNQSQNALHYAWDFGDGLTDASRDPQHRYALPGSYRVTLTVMNEIGCADSTSLAWLMVAPDKVLRIPNAFSPNGDGINDRWEIDGLRGIPGCQVTIFNRWGQPVYESIGYERPWDGTWRGKLSPSGTYYYVVRAKPKDKPYTGWVVLLR